MARILFLTQVLPYPLDSGAKIRAYYVLKRLAQNHQVTLVSFTRGDNAPGHVAALESLGVAVHTVPMTRSWAKTTWAALKAGLTGQPVVIARDEVGEMHALLRRVVGAQSFDAVHADQTSMAQYAIFVRSLLQGTPQAEKTRLLLDAHNALWRIPSRLAEHEGNPVKRLALRREARALEAYEKGLLQRFDEVVFVADCDRAALGAVRDGERFPVIPICVDPDGSPMVQPCPEQTAITHLGTMFWPPNVEGVLWYASAVFPQVVAAAPDATLVIIGKNPPAEVAAVAASDPRIQVTGYVADPAGYLSETAAFIVPLRAAGGMRVKILDAWCWGLPVVTTSIGAEGIDVQHGVNGLLADTPDALAQATLSLLTDGELRHRLRENGRQTVRNRYNWRTVYQEWDRVYERLTR
ncbi:MAG: glycosyltransferase [Chloroflexi bacterium]|nr:glycosyltransferase [Chloroflexota bacterium]